MQGKKNMVSIFLSVMSLIFGLISIISFVGIFYIVNKSHIDIKIAQAEATLFFKLFLLIIPAAALAGIALFVAFLKKTNKTFSVVLLATWVTLIIIFFLIITNSVIAPFLYTLY